MQLDMVLKLIRRDAVTLQWWIPAGKGREAGEGHGSCRGCAGVFAAQMTTDDSEDRTKQATGPMLLHCM